MTRGRISRVSDTNSKRATNRYRNANYMQVHYSGPSFSDLSNYILENIFLRLSIKSILVCKSVCKTWHDLISDPEFTKLHFDQTCDQVCPLIYTSDSKSRSEKLYLVQPDKDDFEVKLGMCEHTYSNPGCVCNVKIPLDTRFELPSMENDDFLLHDRYDIVNSCNGLLCLSPPTHYNDVTIFNPVTGEFIILPEDRKEDLSREFINYAFGYSHVTNQYKVVKIVDIGLRATFRVHTIGTGSWRDVASKPNGYVGSDQTYLKGFLYWTCCINPLAVISFDVENECFGLDLGPKVEVPIQYAHTEVGVLRGELCISSMTELGTLHVWSRKDCDAEKVWSQVVFVDMNSLGKEIHFSYDARNYLTDGSLMFSKENALVHVDPRKCRFRFLKIHEKKSNVKKVIDHIPSLVSLKHSLPIHNMKVFNNRTRREGLKSHKLAKHLHIVEEGFPADYHCK